MKKRMVVLSVLVATGASVWMFTRPRTSASFKTPTLKPSVAELNKAFPADSRKVFEQSDNFILYSIEPRPLSPLQKQANTFQGYPIVRKIEITDQKTRADLVAHFYSGMADQIALGYASGCFNPHHAIRATKGQKTVDLVICFLCSNVRVHYGELNSHTGVTREPESFYDAILREAGVPRSPD
jgi:hypothetical protein